MNIVYFLLPMALTLGGAFAVFFVMASRAGQFDDLTTPAHRILLDDDLKLDSPKGTTT